MFEMAKYKDQFISEAREHLDVLNDALLVLEKDPSDSDNINRIFRAFHTIKGNSATMGYVKFSELAHILEDVLAKIRDNELKVNSRIVDLLFDGCDTLEEGLDKVAKDIPEEIEVEKLIHNLKEIIHVKEEIIDVKIEEKVFLNDEERGRVEGCRRDGMIVLRIIVVFDRGNALKNIKGSVIIRDLLSVGEILRTTPSQQEIKAGKFETEIEILLATRKEKKDVEAVINSISNLKHVFVLDLEESYEKPKETAHEEKELAKAEIANKHHEDVIKQIQSVKVNMKRLDKLMNLVGELLISNIRIQDINKKKQYNLLKTVLVEIDRLILDLQDEVMQVRMVPIGNIFNRFPRMVRDLANKEGKKVNLIIEGEEIEFDRTVLDEIGEPLVHALRNCIDHGIENPDERAASGKPAEGTIKLIARREKNHAVIEVFDDGKGIDPQQVKESSIKKGLITKEEAAKMSSKELQMLVFRAGVSTKEIVTDVSGRGVGMDVVMNKIKDLGGSVSLDSEPGKGTSVIMQLPLTVAIITALLVKVGDETYAVPLSVINETVNINTSHIKTVKGNDVFVLRGTEVPIFWMQSLLGHSNFEKKSKLTVIIVNKSGSPVGLVVDSILTQQQILIKSLQNMVKGTKGCAGATILGDGTVALILDIETLL